jgi:hypothetical protein
LCSDSPKKKIGKEKKTEEKTDKENREINRGKENREVKTDKEYREINADKENRKIKTRQR